jgi:lipopolysaccharide/colanic/teichoic acid biosynthesis glycosyltransferase
MRLIDYDASLAVAEALRLPASAWESGDEQYPPEESRSYAFTRRFLDLVVALGVLPFALMGMGVIAIAVKFDSPGPVIFKQKRVGRYGKTFTFYKFRTMWLDARERYPEMYAYSYTPEEVQTMWFKELLDPRVTRMGFWLRRLSVDELPNLFNVIKGDMTLVGPRPEIPEMIPHYTRGQMAKFAVTPGVTGLAQASGRGLLRFQDTIARDLEYVRHRSLLFDLKIIARTFIVVVLRRGAY